MKKLLLILLCITGLTSCNERIVQLPETTNQEITEILDVSPIYMFYDETNSEGIEFNRKNMISTTNWLVNIDKRLTLKQILPHLQYLQEKRHGDGMHKNKDAKNYFSCSNPEIQNLAFIEFTDVEYRNEHSNEYFSKTSNLSTTKKIHIDFNSLRNIDLLFSSDSIITKKSTSNTFIQDLKSSIKLENVNIITNFNENLIYQDYISFKTLFLELKEENITIDNKEFIYK